MVGSTRNAALMTFMVALVRGVNVGGHSKISMARLREIATSCGLDNVESYIQSGNLVFSDTVRTPRRIADSLADGLVESVGIAATVMVRTKPELEQILRSNPFIDRDPTGTNLHVIFLRGLASEFAELPVMTDFGDEDALALHDEIYLYLPSGVGRSKLAAELGKRYGQAGTMRNWRTVMKLVAMLEQMAEEGGKSNA